MTHLHISVPAITRGTLARTHELKSIGKLQREFTTTSETVFFFVMYQIRNGIYDLPLKLRICIFVTTQDHHTFAMTKQGETIETIKKA